MSKHRLYGLVVAAALLLSSLPLDTFAQDFPQMVNPEKYGFELLQTQELEEAGGTAYYLEHQKSGARLFYLDDQKEEKNFSIGFRTPPQDNSGANHVLEHSLLSGSEKYPSKNIMFYLSGNSVATVLNAYTGEDYTFYVARTSNETDYFNIADVYLNGVLKPRILTDENIYRQQGIRKEYSDGAVRYNGVVYNELRMKSMDSTENSLNLVADQMYLGVYGNTTPSFNSGGTVDGIKQLTYQQVLEVYRNYYTPANSLIFVSGKQDIEAMLKLLDSYLAEEENKKPDISWNTPAHKPDQEVFVYHVTDTTQTVDIGILYPGCKATDSRKQFAKEVIFSLVNQEVAKTYPNYYTVGGNMGGIANMAAIFSGVPVEEQEQVIRQYEQTLQRYQTEGFPPEELRAQLAQAEEGSQYEGEIVKPLEHAMDGFTYAGDPFLLQSPAEEYRYLNEHPEYFTQVLKELFLENDKRCIVISGNGSETPKNDGDDLKVTPEELEQIKRETEDFQAWADRPDTPEETANNPVLELKDFKEDHLEAAVTREERNGAVFYHTVKEGKNGTVSLTLPIALSAEELTEGAALVRYLKWRASQMGYDGVYFDIAAFEKGLDPDQIDPRLGITISGNETELSGKIEDIVSWLSEPDLIQGQGLTEFFTQELGQIKDAYRDPYSISYEMMLSAQSLADRYRNEVLGPIAAASIPYLKFVESAVKTPEENERWAEEMRRILADTLQNQGVVAGYSGSVSGYSQVKGALEPLLRRQTKQPAEHVPVLLAGYPSVLTLSNQKENVSHIMQTGYLKESGIEYSGQMDVLGKVLSTNYLFPILRGKMGAYGTGAHFTYSNMVFSVAGLENIDQALEVYAGAGEYLRGLSMTQEELDQFIISAVNEFDQYNGGDSYNGYYAELTDMTVDTLREIREEILSTTVEDLKGYADLVDELLAQNRVFAVANTESAANTVFPFGYQIDESDFLITPRLTREDIPYMQGRTEQLFEPEGELSRAETVAIFCRIMADQRQGGITPFGRFTDIQGEEWYAGAVAFLSDKDIMRGDTNGSFRPDEPITRAEFAAVAAKFVPADGPNQAGVQFSDIGADDWAEPSIRRLVSNGYLSGYYDGSFRPNAFITRAEAAALVNRLLGRTKQAYETDTSQFMDVPSGHWAYQEILSAVQ